MGGELARYVFLPYVRQGNDLILQNIELHGPGDVIGLDPRFILRTDPPFTIAVNEPNFMPLIEFSRIDLPWCFTPSKLCEDTSNRLNPWICLIVLKAKDGEFEEPSMSSDQPLPTIKVNKHNLALPLPDLTYSWAWAHVQVTTDKDKNSFTLDVLRNIMTHTPEKIVSRLICPRKLEPKEHYHAFVVPTFESGRLAGLVQKIPASTPILEPAWTNNLDSVVLPYYFKWEFRTGLRGDFAYLARLLESTIVDSREGIRYFNYKHPSYVLHLKKDTEDAGKLVLRIRGDLLKKYPSTLIYAVKGVWIQAEIGDYYISTSSDGRKWKRAPVFNLNEDQTKYPIFKEFIPPDITFFLFDLTGEQARGNNEIGNHNDQDKGNNPGWYFVIEEPIGETCFGIDEQVSELPEGAVLDNWDNLTWQYFIRRADWNQNSNYINGVNPDPDSTLDPPWDSDSANRAEITLQKPKRIVVHADDIMLKED